LPARSCLLLSRRRRWLFAPEQNKVRRQSRHGDYNTHNDQFAHKNQTGTR
jgi:hypothetical protein